MSTKLTENEKKLIDDLSKLFLRRGYFWDRGKRAGTPNMDLLARTIGIDSGQLGKILKKQNRFTQAHLETISREFEVSFVNSHKGIQIVEERKGPITDTQDNLIFVDFKKESWQKLDELTELHNDLDGLMVADDNTLLESFFVWGDRRWEESTQAEKARLMRKHIRRQIAILAEKITELKNQLKQDEK